MIRAARADDVPALREIVVEAGEVFRHIGMGDVADNGPPTVEDLSSVQAAGRMWVAVDAADAPLGVVWLEIVDGLPHVEQVSVRPSHGRRGLGRQLLEATASWALASGFTTMTLTTFVDVPFNGPYYERLGWRAIASSELTPELAAVRREEVALGLDRWPRTAMRLDLV